ncbi:MAG: peptidase U32 family protein, partial [Terriglobia bacterium]
DIEVFLHGGICYHFDGDCFLSSFFSQEVAFDRTLGRNRLFGQNNAKGECHLICKRPCNAEKAGQTNSARFMRRDDLVGLDRIPGYVEAGVTIFKIEGRAMPVSYVGAATKLYREAIDLYEASPADYRIRPDWSDALKQLLEARRQYERDWQIR